MSVHLYAAKPMPATRIRLPDPAGVVLHFKPRSVLTCHTCGRRRWASKLLAYPYYDHVRLRCREKCTPRRGAK